MGKKRKKKNVILNIFIAAAFLAGAGIFFYPTFSDMWNQYRNALLISNYDQAVSDLSADNYEKLWKEAEEYNAEHPVNSIVDAFDEEEDYEPTHPYDEVLDPNGDGLMGSIEIPRIQAKLAIYHGLSKGAGHVEGTSLRIGGPGTHAVLAAHRGLPSAKLFTDLDQIEKGDIFILHILGKNLAYKVDQIKTVLPSETEELDIVEGEDHVTLVTCTPYGVNTHRLLVRGIRTEYVEKEEADNTIPQKIAQTDPKKIMIAGSAVLVILILLVYLIIRNGGKRRRSGNKEEAGKSGKEN